MSKFTNLDKLLFVKNKHKFIDRTGEFHINNQGCRMVIIEYYGSQKISVLFEDGTIIKDVEYCQITRGTIKNNNFPSVYGVGKCTEGKYSYKTHSYIYNIWHSMLERCYDEKSLEVRPTYKDVVVCEDWHNFQIFAEWVEENYVQNFHLDKDILFKGNKIYAPLNCRFVPQEINKIFIKSNSKRGVLPIGVKQNKMCFEACISINGKQTYLGLYKTPEEAFQVYKAAKEKYIKEMAETWKDMIDIEVYNAMYNYKVEVND